MAPGAGVLYVVATPIGNLEDFTFRGLRTLKEVDLIAAEDTRRTAKLLAHYGVSKPVVSLREHNEVREAPRLVKRLLEGRNIALVSDAGTPAIADPGARLVRAALDKGITVSPIPGPSAVTAALSVAGLASTEFTFMGFPPASGAGRREWFERLYRESRAVVFFESPHRIDRTLADAREMCVERPINVYREITKINEELVKSHNVAKVGEFTIVVSPRTPHNSGGSAEELGTSDLGRLIDKWPLSEDKLVRTVSALMSVSLPSARNLVKKHRISVKQQSVKVT